MELKGKYTDAKIYATVIEDEAIAQIQGLINNPVSEGSQVRMMPDCHAGKGCTIGTTMTIADKICPNLVGVDIGCGVLAFRLNVKREDLDLEAVDKGIRKAIPLGFSTRQTPIDPTDTLELLHQLKCFDHLVNVDRIVNSRGSLGGGNHYIELNEGSDGVLWLVVHTGSRNLGQQVATYYQKMAEQQMKDRYKAHKLYVDTFVKTMKDKSQIQPFLEANNKPAPTKADLDLAYLEGEEMLSYLHDMDLVQKYADRNRHSIGEAICRELGWDVLGFISSIHNYIDVDNGILRKGAISARKGQRVIIPLNMEDGSIIAVGKGNPDWNYSAPHGAGRIMSRKKAKEAINVEEVKESMAQAGVFTTSINENTIDEAKKAYKDPQAILDVVQDTLDIVDIIKPIYNLKG